MVSNNITEGVGKKIVEALKQQSDIEIQNVVENSASVQDENSSAQEQDSNIEVENENITIDYDSQSENNQYAEHSETPLSFSTPNINSFNHTISQETFASDLDGFEIPSNIAVLKQLINQLPAGVSKQTGAQIIKQTMEALGISMKSVLQEAQQVQESLNNSSRECQASILEYKKQIGLLEKQAQKFQRQYSALNEIISLFVQTNI